MYNKLKQVRARPETTGKNGQKKMNITIVVKGGTGGNRNILNQLPKESFDAYPTQFGNWECSYSSLDIAKNALKECAEDLNRDEEGSCYISNDSMRLTYDASSAEIYITEEEEEEKSWAVQNIQTGLIEESGEKSDMINMEKEDEDLRLCYVVNGKIYDSESDYVNE